MGTGNSQKNGTGAGQNLLALPAGVELGQYRIIRKLGQGGFGITYLAEVIGSGEQVVIKENLPTFCAMRDRTTLQVAATDPDDELQEYAEYLKRFVNEARLLAQLNHPNIVKVFGAFEALGTAYYVMPWVGGQELQTAAPASGVITESWLLPILRTLLSTLEYLHGRNIYHRDVKPANILLTEDGIPVLIDFGTARAIISDRSATHVGSPGYSPIEQITARGKRGPWTDVYSLGATCYRLITGERPPEANERLAEEEDPLLPLAPRAELRGRFSPAFLATIDKALALRGKNRWQTAAEWLAVLPVPAPQPAPEQASPTTPDIATTPIAVAPEPARRSRPNVALILLILLLALGIPGGYVLYQHSQATAQQLRDELARVEAEQKAEKERQKPENQLAAKGISEAEYDSKIIYAAAEGDTDLLALLIAAKANVNAASSDNEHNTPLSMAAWKGRTECVKLLLAARDIDVNKADKNGSTPLHWAAREGHSECVKLLLAARDIDVNKAGEYGCTPLFLAALNGHSECVKLLLAAPGIDVNKANNFGCAPLDRAAYKGHSMCVRLLLAAPGIDVINKANEDGRTPLHEAAMAGETECVKLLLVAPGIDVNAANKNGETPLYRAARKGRTECVKLLLAAPGIDVNKADKNGETPLDWAAWNGHTECVRLLLAAPGIDVNAANKNGQTPLYWAACWGRTECVRLLLAAPGIDVNAADKDGRTPLRNAAYWGRTECVRMLLASPGIDVNKADKDGRTPLKEAESEGRTECARLIRAAGGKE